MRALLVSAFLVLTHALTVFGQEKQYVVIGSLIEKPNALLIVNPPNGDQGVLLPQLSTAQRLNLKPKSPSEDGLIVYDSGEGVYYYWSNGQWLRFNGVSGGSSFNSFTSIDPLDFQPMSAGNDVRHNNVVVFEEDHSFLTLHNTNNGTAVAAPVQLPHGAFLEGVTLYYMDNHPQRDMKFALIRKSLSGASETIVEWQSNGASSDVSNRTLNGLGSRRTVDLERYTYRIIVWFDLAKNEEVNQPSKALQRIYGIRIQYRN